MATSMNDQNMSAEDMKKRKALALGLLEAYKGKIDSGLNNGSVADMGQGLRGLFQMRLMVDEDAEVKYWKSWMLAYAEDALFEAIDRQKAQWAAEDARYEAYLEEQRMKEEEEIPPPPPGWRWGQQEEAEDKAKDVVKELSEEEKQSMVQLEALEKELEQKIVPLESGKLKTHLINLFLPKVDGVAHYGNMEIKQRRKALIKKADSLDGGEKSSSATTEGEKVKVETKVETVKTKTKGKVGKKRKSSKWHKRAVKVALFPARLAVMGLCQGLRLAKAGVMEASQLRVSLSWSLAIYRKGKGGEYDDDATCLTDCWD